VDTVRPTSADVGLLQLVERCRLVDSRQLRLTIGRESHRRAFLYRLQRLFHSRHLTRPQSQLNRWWTKGEPTKHYVYGLGPKGYSVLHPEDGDESNAVLRLRDQRIGSDYIDHRLKLTEAVLCFEEAAGAEQWPLTWTEGDDFRATTGLTRTVAIADAKKPQPLNPDAFVTFTADTIAARYFLEIDNGTEPIERHGSQRWERTSILRKLAVYDQLAPRRGDTDYDRRHRAPWPFRVLTVTTTPERMENMRQLAQAMDPKKKGSRLFLFTTLDRVTLDRPRDVLTEPIWWSPNDNDQPPALTD